VLAGIGLAGLWTSDRTLMLRLSPPRYLGQFYGLYSMVGRFGQVVGPLLWGFIAITLGLGRPIAMFSLFLLTLVGFIIIRPVSDANRVWRAEELVAV
jgi:MFS-type transporter involved in bile tolerance (Atg22 family)